MVNTMIKTSNGNIYFDAVLNTEHNLSVTPTQHPVQTGASVTDHAFVNPEEISISFGYSDVHHNDGYSAKSFEKLYDLMNKREVMTLVTRITTYTDMIITSISVPDNFETMYGLKATIVFTRIKMVTVATVQVQPMVSGSKSPKSPSASPSQSEKDKQPAADSESQKKQSILRQTQEAEKQKKRQEDAKAAAAVVQKVVGSVVSSVVSFVKGVASAITSTPKTTTKTVTKPAPSTNEKVLGKTKVTALKS